MLRSSVRVLLIDDDEDDYVITKDLLSSIPMTKFDLDWAPSVEAGLIAMEERLPDVCLVDYRMGALNGLDFMREAVSRGFHVPMVMMTGHGDRQVDLEAIQIGAADYLIKGEVQPPILERTLRHAMDRARALEALRESEERYRSVIAAMEEGIVLQDAGGAIQATNAAAVRILGLEPGQPMQGGILMDPKWRAIHEDGTPVVPHQHPVIVTLRTGRPCSKVIMGLHRPDDSLIWVSVNAQPLLKAEETRPYAVVASFLDITDWKRSEETLRLLESAVQNADESIVITTADLAAPGPVIRFVNPGFTRMTGYSAAEVIGQSPRILQGPNTDRAELDRAFRELESGHSYQGEMVNYGKDGSDYVVEWRVAPIRNQRGEITHFASIQRDITERRKLEAQLRDSQKLEAIGLLAGGVAHDFNNLLTAITGYSELLLGEIEQSQPMREEIEEIRKAADRAASLTQQLLAFARRQIVEPHVLILNDVLRGMDRLLHGLLGERIELAIELEPALGRVKADPGQIEQLLMNLVLNARDAMPEGGKLTVETANAELDSTYALQHIAARPGPYVLLAVSDTGHGMDAQTRARVFEPFFTTKERGKGTGLGLATVYGIVKQSGGNIWVYSEPGRGTTFKIYLPIVDEPLEVKGMPPPRATGPRGAETILLAEDDELVRALVRGVLQKQGYTVLEASGGKDALLIADQYGGPIHFLVTDVVMPGMNGRQLAEKLRSGRPDLLVLYISGYTDNAIVHQGTLDAGMEFLQKPFTPESLLRRVREVLDASRR